jgi:conjugal transfer pilus assembly protein TraD
MNIDDPLFLGKGFEWAPNHAQYAREIYARKKSQIKPPQWYMRLRERLGLASTRNIHGAPWLHGIGLDEERDIFMDADDLYNHTGIFGTTGAGKGRLIEFFLMQALARPNETVIIIDPKLDEGMLHRAYGEMLRQGRPWDFHFFGPAHPERSVRLNPMQNYSTGSQLASRTTSTLPPASRGDNFGAFVWKSISNVVQGMIAAGEPPSLKAIRYLVEGNVEDLFVRAFRRYIRPLETRFPEWEQHAREIARNQSGDGKRKSGGGLWSTYLAYYESVTSNFLKSEALEGLRSILNHPGEHYQKMIVSISPQLTALTTEDIGAMLSPDYDDPDDPRPIVNSKQIINRGQVLYMALNSLADNLSSGWMGSLVLSDLVSCAADRYNYEGGGVNGVTVIVDELSEVANEQFVQALGKARGAGFRIIFATQALADLVVRFGSAEFANQILGNVNTQIFMRLKDRESKEYASEKMSTTRVVSVKQGHAGRTATDTATDFVRNLSTQFESADLEARVPPDLFDEIPDLQCFAALHDGRKLKLRIPYSETESELKYHGKPY